MTASNPFPPPGSKTELEEGSVLSPRFGADGLVTCITTDVATGEILMVAHMNPEALAKTLETGEAWYWSRSRGNSGTRARPAGRSRPFWKYEPTATRTPFCSR